MPCLDPARPASAGTERPSGGAKSGIRTSAASLASHVEAIFSPKRRRLDFVGVPKRLVSNLGLCQCLIECVHVPYR